MLLNKALKRKSKELSKRLTLGQAHFELQNFEQAKDSGLLHEMTTRRSKRQQIAGSNTQKTKKFA